MNSVQFEIPEISTDDLLSRYFSIRPIIYYNWKRLFCRQLSFEELQSKSFLWMKPDETWEIVDMNTLRMVGNIQTLHTFTTQGLFQPSVAEVLCQIPSELLEYVTAFEITSFPRTTNALYESNKALNAGFHSATATLYGAV